MHKSAFPLRRAPGASPAPLPPAQGTSCRWTSPRDYLPIATARSSSDPDQAYADAILAEIGGILGLLSKLFVAGAWLVCIAYCIAIWTGAAR